MDDSKILSWVVGAGFTILTGVLKYLDNRTDKVDLKADEIDKRIDQMEVSMNEKISNKMSSEDARTMIKDLLAPLHQQCQTIEKANEVNHKLLLKVLGRLGGNQEDRT